ncbi:MAG TPA: hypothetical protein VF427_02520 [Noviherbaspirillum sp.]
MKTFNTLLLLIAGATSAAIVTSPALAQDAPHAAKKVATKKAAKKNAHTASEDGKEPDITGLQPTDYHCELGNKLTIYQNADDDQKIALRWNKHLHAMTRVSTTTGANRFEDAKKGLVWIGIPAKGMLLDSKKGQQLANECKSAEQMQKPEQKS